MKIFDCFMFYDENILLDIRMNTLDKFIDAMLQIAIECENNTELLHEAPHNTPVQRLDEALAARQPNLKWSEK